MATGPWHTERMSNFVLIHGSMHGSWCWRDLVPELERRGHSAITPELPCDEVTAGLTEYAAAVEACLEGIHERDDVVWVGHSLGSRTIPVVASRRPGSTMIFLCSVPTGSGPVDSAAFAGMVTADYADAEVEERPDGLRRMRPQSAKHVFFHDCEDATADWAARRLRWQGPKPLTEAAPIDAWPDAPMHVVLTREDRAVRLEWAREEASRWLDGRDPVLLPGGHSPFFSQPELLADTLVRCIAA
jgi:pimeloyl-ACP methyl ester carboxylesterase